MEAKYGVSRWPDEKEIFKKMERLVNEHQARGNGQIHEAF
mgnify:CR=1 FL=1